MSADTNTVDEVLAALADSRRRRIVRTLRNSDDDVLTVDELESKITSKGEAVENTMGDQERVDVDLYHVHLPKLAEAGLVAFDTRNREVRYRSVDVAEELLTLIEDDV